MCLMFMFSRVMFMFCSVLFKADQCPYRDHKKSAKEIEDDKVDAEL